MNYVDTCRNKLSDWIESGSKGHHRFRSPSSNITLDVNISDTYIVQEGILRLAVRDNVVFLKVCNIEDFFIDPLNATKEEAELFKLEHGLEYPKELINDL